MVSYQLSVLGEISSPVRQAGHSVADCVDICKDVL